MNKKLHAHSSEIASDLFHAACSLWGMSATQQETMLDIHPERHLLLKPLLQIDRLCSDVFCHPFQANAFMRRRGSFPNQQELSPLDFFLDKNLGCNRLLMLLVDKAYLQFGLDDPTPILLAQLLTSKAFRRLLNENFHSHVTLNTWLTQPLENSNMDTPLDYLLQNKGEQKLIHLLEG